MSLDGHGDLITNIINWTEMWVTSDEYLIGSHKVHSRTSSSLGHLQIKRAQFQSKIRV